MGSGPGSHVYWLVPGHTSPPLGKDTYDQYGADDDHTERETCSRCSAATNDISCISNDCARPSSATVTEIDLFGRPDAAGHAEARPARGGTTEHRVPLAWAVQWAGRLMTAACGPWWPFTLNRVELSVRRYPNGARCPRHVDHVPGAGHWRRLSATVASSDPAAYHGGVLVIDYGLPLAVDLWRGDCVVFAASTLHSVDPVDQGERWAPIVWASGP